MDRLERLAEQDSAQASNKQQLFDKTFTRWLIGLGLMVLVVGLLARFVEGPINTRFQIFATIFMGIFVEAVPFLLAGSLVSGLLEVFVGKRMLERLIPRHPVPAAFVGSLLGFVFPVCECGVVPVTRRLYQKGMPLTVGVSFLLAAPVINPIVLLSTVAVFGWGPVVYGRFAFTIIIATIIGLVFTVARPRDVLIPESVTMPDLQLQAAAGMANLPTMPQASSSTAGRLWDAVGIAGDDFIDMVRFLILGCMLAATMQTFLPQAVLLQLGEGPVVSVVVMMVLAFILSVCSTVDAFLALSFAGTFTVGSILAFLTFGPMVDTKSALMFLGVFRRRTVAYLLGLSFMLMLVIGVFINLFVNW
ncbi:MAG: permease [Chloroflexota bacterium]|jgi:uncharacterized protein